MGTAGEPGRTEGSDLSGHFIFISFLDLYFVFMHVRMVCTGLSESVEVGGQWQKSVLSLYRVDPRNPTQAVRLDGKRLYRLRHLANPIHFILKLRNGHRLESSSPRVLFLCTLKSLIKYNYFSLLLSSSFLVREPCYYSSSLP